MQYPKISSILKRREYNIYVQLIKLNNSLEKVANTSIIIFDIFYF